MNSKLVNNLGHVSKKLWNFDKWTLLYGVFCSIYMALQTYANIYLAKLIVNELANPKVSTLMGYLALVIILKILDISLMHYKRYREFLLNEKFDIHEKSNLITILSNRELIEKEHPSFKGEYGMWVFAASKYLDIYFSFIQLLQSLLTTFILLYYLIESFWVGGLLILLFSVVRYIVEVKTLPRRLALNDQIQRTNRVHEYYYQLMAGSPSQKELTVNRLFDFFKQKWIKEKQQVLGLNRSLQKLSINTDLIGQVLSLINYAVIIVVVVILIFNKSLSVGDYVAITLSVGVVEYGIYALIKDGVKLFENITYLDDFRKKTTNSLMKIKEEKQGFQLSSSIAVNNLSFSYPNSSKLNLRNISLEIKQQEKVVILGNNAAGKTTLIKLLLGLYTAPSQTVFYDGIPQEKIDRDSILEKSGVVFQDYQNYMMSLKENLVLFNKDLEDKPDEILELLRLVSLEDLIGDLNRNLGYLTDDSINLSGGQWQKIALARVLSKSADLLVFDEPTASLDPVSELQVFNSLFRVFEQKTVIIITHRIGIASKMDKIIFMKDGEIVESGSHRELLALRGPYYEMWLNQKEWYQDNELEEAIA